jgi:hypothetical protein
MGKKNLVGHGAEAEGDRTTRGLVGLFVSVSLSFASLFLVSFRPSRHPIVLFGVPKTKPNK